MLEVYIMLYILNFFINVFIEKLYFCYLCFVNMEIRYKGVYYIIKYLKLVGFLLMILLLLRLG